MDKKNLYSKAVLKWGVSAQIMMAIEELSELSVELCHWLRINKESNKNKLVDELADVEIMLEQLKQMFNLFDDVRIKKSHKLERLNKLL